MRRGRRAWIGVVLSACAAASLALPARGSGSHGSLVLTGGGFGPGVLDRFRALAGGPDASVIYIPSASSGIKLPDGFTWIPPELPNATNNESAFRAELERLFGVRRVTLLHSRDRAVWDSRLTADVLAGADAVWISGGNAGRLAGYMRNTRSHRALARRLREGQVFGGQSAGAIIAGSFVIRGQPGKPVLIVRTHHRGFALVPDVAINPHLTQASRQDELVQVIELFPELLGIGIDENAAIVVTGSRFEVIGNGRVAIYDGRRHGDEAWYYYLVPGSQFDLKERRPLATPPPR